MTVKLSAESVMAACDAIRIREYMARGRRCVDLTDEALKGEWVAAFRTWTDDFGDIGAREREMDAAAEANIRKLSLPYDLVRAELDQLFAEVNQMSAAMHGTEGADALNAAIMAELERATN